MREMNELLIPVRRIVGFFEGKALLLTALFFGLASADLFPGNRIGGVCKTISKG